MMAIVLWLSSAVLTLRSRERCVIKRCSAPELKLLTSLMQFVPVIL